VAAKYAARGDDVTFISTTNGATGHHEIGGVELAERRYEEAQAAADVLDIEYEIWDNHTGELMPTVANRKETIRAIRRFAPDLVLTHRATDYHPDHRYTSTLVRDAAYIVEAPNTCQLTAALEKTPVIAHVEDGFEKPRAFEADVVVGIDDVIDEKLEVVHRHESQMYEWLAYNQDRLEEGPDEEAPRREWLAEWRLPEFAATADRYRGQLVER